MKKKMLLIVVGLMIPFAASGLKRRQLIERGYKEPTEPTKTVYTGTGVTIEGVKYAFNDVTSKQLSKYLTEKRGLLNSSNFETIVPEVIAVLKERGINYTTTPVANRTVKDTFKFVQAAFGIASTPKQKELMKDLLQTVYDNKLRTPTKTGMAAYTDGKSLEESIDKATFYGTPTTSNDIKMLTGTIYPAYNIGIYKRGPMAPGETIEHFVLLKGRRKPYSDLNDKNLSSYFDERTESDYLNTDYERRVAKLAHVLEARGIDDVGVDTTHNNTFKAIKNAVTVYEGMGSRATAKDKEALIKLLKASKNDLRRITPTSKDIDPVPNFSSKAKPLRECVGNPLFLEKKRTKLDGYYSTYLK